LLVNEKTFYKPRKPIAPVGIYFSPKTRNYYPDTFIESYPGDDENDAAGSLRIPGCYTSNAKRFYR
jgi:hypothetical protein